MMNSRGAKVLAVLGLIVFILAGCGGGNRLISNRDGKVESGELILDSLPMRPDASEYVIGHGDALDILFLYAADFNQIDLKVRPDGKISLPYVGDIVAVGKPVSALDSVITARYAEIIVNPDVTVIVRSFRPQVVYALGEVASPGGYEYHDGMTLANALALGGGPSKSGKRSEVLVIRRVAPDHVVGIQVDINDLLSGKRFDLDIPLQAFDIVYVPKSKIAQGQDFMLALKELILTPSELYLRGWQVANVKILYDFYRKSGATY
ncbi:MAG: polysaccharide biosynthesis/export family protein [Candidatus Krumholzibacteria bacterium]|nr:polysaccharide biosynthesis/export family protein [Candidatus Krumholzibacteria bacterium]